MNILLYGAKGQYSMQVTRIWHILPLSDTLMEAFQDTNQYISVSSQHTHAGTVVRLVKDHRHGPPRFGAMHKPA